MKNLPDFKKAIEVAYKEVIKEKSNEINSLIFKLRTIADPKLKESYKKYFPESFIEDNKDFVSFMEKEIHKYESESPLSREIDGLLGSRQENEEFERLKREVLEKLYNENEQKILFQSVCMLIAESLNPDYFWDANFEFVQEVHERVYYYLEEELKCLDADMRLKLCAESSDKDDSTDLFIQTLEITKTILESDLRVLLNRGMQYFEAIWFLEDLVKLYEAASEIKKGIFDLYDPDGSWKPINKEHLAKFSKAIKLKEINENFLKEMMKDNMSIIRGRLSSQLREQCKETEKRLRDTIRYVLAEKRGEDWFRQSVSEKIHLNCKFKLNDNRFLKTNDASDCLDLGECKEVIIDEKNWKYFKKVFIDSPAGFLYREDFKSALDLIRNHRNPDEHRDPYESGYKDIERLKIDLDKINKCIDIAINK